MEAKPLAAGPAFGPGFLAFGVASIRRSAASRRSSLSEGRSALSSETIDPTKLPDDETLRQLATIHIKWAQLDWLSTVGLINLLNLPEGEAAILFGTLDVMAKLRKAKQILDYRKLKINSAVMHQAILKLDGAKELRNAITHGFYNGTTPEGEILFTLLPQLEGSSEEYSHVLYSADKQDLRQHLSALEACFTLIVGAFPTLQRREYARQARVRSNASANPRQPKHRPKPLRPR